MFRTHNLHDRLDQIDGEVLAARRAALERDGISNPQAFLEGSKVGCTSLLQNIRVLLHASRSQLPTPDMIVAEIAETARCDSIYTEPERMRTVRSRLLERLGPDLYKKCATPDGEGLSEVEERRVGHCIAHYEHFIRTQARSSLPFGPYALALMADYALHIGLALTAGGLVASAPNLIRNSQRWHAAREARAKTTEAKRSMSEVAKPTETKRSTVSAVAKPEQQSPATRDPSRLAVGHVPHPSANQRAIRRAGNPRACVKRACTADKARSNIENTIKQRGGSKEPERTMANVSGAARPAVWVAVASQAGRNGFMDLFLRARRQAVVEARDAVVAQALLGYDLRNVIVQQETVVHQPAGTLCPQFEN
ncbi:uncharacterized protein MONBRDRAFT_4706 [Monosiga brevicollis MX1]|uniref:Uncharacterized protein n=1 Tax=Monosiga brevicollis TaxID=81824 RepID=A9UNP3_MONBE|nr:uncharacterized protein MONBRDRAFT_4706 [Monosiga brevicollis MX1]EDQ92277.1 predicted protein [Monosiga brevicollis MX1]|eukprot:XP_001742039.1 hypothetical protein [Monosiga brevicollis MX1]